MTTAAKTKRRKMPRKPIETNPKEAAQNQKRPRRHRGQKTPISKRDPSLVHHIGIGIDTGRYGHRASFMHEDKQKAAEAMTVMENCDDYQTLRAQLFQFHQQFPLAHLHVRIDAAGQYATNLEVFLRDTRGLPMTISIGEPKRNKDYHSAHAPKSQTDATESWAMARYAVVEKPEDTHGVPQPFIALRRIASKLQANTKQTTRLINQLHETLSATFTEFASIQKDISAQWILKLLAKYPTAERIANAHLSSIETIPQLRQEKARAIHMAAKSSVSMLKGEFAEALVKTQVAELEHSQKEVEKWFELLEKAYDELPAGPHQRIVTIMGIGKRTAAAITASAISIDRFESDRKLTGYFGLFPQELQSGVDKFGRSIPPGKKIMSRKGNNLVRGLLWQCVKSASMENNCNPKVRALYLRRIAAGDTPMTAYGYCMTKLMRQVFGVWVTDFDFDKKYGKDSEESTADQIAEETTCEAPQETETEPLGHTTSTEGLGTSKANQSEPKEVVTKDPAPLEPVSGKSAKAEHANVNPSSNPRQSKNGQSTTSNAAGVSIDYAALRVKLHIVRVLQLMGCELDMGKAQQRLECPTHGPGDKDKRTFSVSTKRNIFKCFDSQCGCKGNALDLWQTYSKLPLYEAAIDLTARLGIELPTHTKTATTP